MKITILIVALIAVLGAGGWYYKTRTAAPAEAEASKVQVAKVERGNIHLAVAATGRIVSNLDVDIKAKASGTVIKLPFDISDKVKQGDLLVELDPVDEQRAVDQAKVALTSSQARQSMANQNLKIAELKLGTDRMRVEANLQSAQARTERAKVKADRLKKAMEANASTVEEYDAARTDAIQSEADLKVSQAAIEELKQEEAGLELRKREIALSDEEVKSDQIALANAQQRLVDTRVLAPMDGMVVAKTVQTGTIISSGISNVGGGTAILTISDLSHVFVLASVDESDIGRVALDQAVAITADAYPGRRFKGKVVRISRRGTTVSNVTTFEVKIEVVDNKKDLLFQEMTANVEIVVAEKEDVLTVPSESVERRKGKQTVTIKNAEGQTEEREVKVGISDNTRTEITEGLNEGDTLVIKAKDADSRWRQGQQRPGGPGGPGGAPGGGGFPLMPGGGGGGGGGRRG